ncbi:extracellular ligand-binding receptor [Tanacetum coccineum]|uniref:Extracellular ligand-binding receptor n=1 Tax=Tanacetum coccineum TaxID=301880 RepID=A0ABQ4Z7D4_9ASTR
MYREFPFKENRKDSQLYYQPPLASCVGGTTSNRWVPIQNRTFSTHITSAELEIYEKNSTLWWVEHYIYGRKKNSVGQLIRRGDDEKDIKRHCSPAFSSDSLLENTTSSVIMSNETQANINTPVLVTDLLPRCRGRPPLTDISNEYLDHGDPTNICGACNASLWDFEARLKRPFHNIWSYSTCCGYGKVKKRSKAQEVPAYNEIPVGVILDMGSWIGKTVNSCISMALSDFYMVNSHYNTRIVVHNKDTHGEPLHALSAAVDLLAKQKVQAIIASESIVDAKFLAVLGDEAQVPILSLSPTPSSNKHPYFFQITKDEATQLKGISALAESFGWKNVIVICEDTDNGQDMAKLIANAFRLRGILVTYTSLILTPASSELVYKELYKLKTMHSKFFVIHVSPSLAAYLFLNAKHLGMMDAGYKWIITSKTMNFLNFMDGEVIESMQGVVGFKSYIPKSRDLQKFISKWREDYELTNINAYAIWAYDAVSALAMAVESTQTLRLNSKDLNMTASAQWTTAELLNQMLRISFDGLGGAFRFMNQRVSAQVLEIINVIGKGERRVGFWTKDVAFTKNFGNMNSFFDDGLEAIVWPGGIQTNPTQRMLQCIVLTCPNLFPCIKSRDVELEFYLVNGYTATLSSLLTVEQIQLASKGGSIVYTYDTFVAGVLGGSFKKEKLFKISDALELEYYADALSRGSKKGGVDAIVIEIPYIKEFLVKYPTGYTMTPYEVITNGFGFPFPLGSPWAPLISTQIAKLREDGTLKMLENKWLNPGSKESAPLQKVLNFRGLRGLFLISGVSMAAALFLYMLYYIHDKWHFC